MQDKYLPIGTVVTLKNQIRKIMIIGYYSPKYEGKIVIYDYVGCSYPEGLLSKDYIISFNHEDIINLDFVGFKCDEYKELNNNLCNNLDIENNQKEVNQLLDNNKDEDVVDIFADVEPLVQNTEEIVPIELDELSEPENHDEENNSNENNHHEEKMNDFHIPHYHFDANGIIISE